MGENEAAGVLAEMAWRAHELAGEIERQAQASVRKVEVQRLDVLVLDAVFRGIVKANEYRPFSGSKLAARCDNS